MEVCQEAEKHYTQRSQWELNVDVTWAGNYIAELNDGLSRP